MARQQFGSFADWFIFGLGIETSQALVVDVHLGQPLPDANQLADEFIGVVITGSAAMVTDQDSWLLSTQHWLTNMAKHKIPTLGVCYGHQVLADLLGGRVDYNPKGRNMGMSEFHLASSASSDDLFKNHPKQMPTFASHLQSVTRLPQSATLLGSCALDENHAFKAEETIWGVQFHPEWNQPIMKSYIQSRREALLKEGFNPEQMLDHLAPCNAAHATLSRFAQLATVNRKALIQA